MSAWRAAIIMEEAGEMGNVLSGLVLVSERCTDDSALFPGIEVNLRLVTRVEEISGRRPCKNPAQT